MTIDWQSFSRFGIVHFTTIEIELSYYHHKVNVLVVSGYGGQLIFFSKYCWMKGSRFVSPVSTLANTH